MIRSLLAAALLVAAPALAPEAARAQDNIPVQTAPVVTLRGLDRLSGELTEFQVRAGSSTTYRDLEISVAECRVPADNPTGDAYAYLTIKDRRATEPNFEGWMVASSPALNALDHMRYDVWLIRCSSS
ncbi:DUF2155 domain-containing protein [Poseidonocella sp. HB161398]|uniref:DUF2155 domain-containing protein n=1 Tax=Poseidonocella sp. HB161398 TaxID=2320855 RepID=UPI0011093412|nr:DUF2155 domain-containing protein [Poseidonocella sp. HB161398]